MDIKEEQEIDQLLSDYDNPLIKKIKCPSCDETILQMGETKKWKCFICKKCGTEILQPKYKNNGIKLTSPNNIFTRRLLNS